MKNIMLLVLLFIGNTLAVNAQDEISGKDAKKWDKAVVYFNNEQYWHASEIMSELVSKYPSHKKLMEDYLVVSEREYLSRKTFTENLLNSISVSAFEIVKETTDSLDSDSLKKDVIEAIENTNPILAKLLNVCALARNSIYELESVSEYARHYKVDEKIETKSNDVKSREQFNMGEKALKEKDYDQAIEHFNNAIEIDSTFYKATLNLGKTYWELEEYETAFELYKDASFIQPTLLEPKKVITEAYMDLSDYDKAEAACIDALLTYPDIKMFLKFDRIQRRKDNEFVSSWLPKYFLPNNMNEEQTEELELPWSLYRNAKNTVVDSLVENGIIVFEEEADTQYLEVLSWNYMLEQIDEDDYPELEFAFDMKKKGYLDCYVLFSLFNVNLYDQFRHFADRNEDKIKEYIDKYLVY